MVLNILYYTGHPSFPPQRIIWPHSTKVRNPGIMSIMALYIYFAHCRGSFRYYWMVHSPQGTVRMSRQVRRCHKVMDRGGSNSLSAIARHLVGVRTSASMQAFIGPDFPGGR